MQPYRPGGDTQICLSTGIYLDLLEPNPRHFRVQDIVAGLSKICRFGGQLDCFYSVAEHSVLCCRLAEQRGAEEDVCRAVLLHDASEAFLGDIVSPLKSLLPRYQEIESRLQEIIYGKYGVPQDDWVTSDVKWIDQTMLMHEKRLLVNTTLRWNGEEDVFRIPHTDLTLRPVPLGHVDAAKLLSNYFTQYSIED